MRLELIFWVLVQEIRSLEASVDTEHTSFIHVENVYENILQQTLDKEVTQGEPGRPEHAGSPSQGARLTLTPPLPQW